MPPPYKPSPLAIGTTKALDPRASPRTTDIDLPSPSIKQPEKPLMQYDARRAKRQMTRPIFGGRK